MDKNTKITAGISIAVIVIFITAIYAFGGKKSTDVNNLNLNATSTEQEVAATGTTYTTGLPISSIIPSNKASGLSVVDQLAGDLVAFSSVDFAEDTWVLVYEDKGGEPANLLGSGLFFAGTSEGETPLLRATEVGKKYYVTFVADNGDRVFELNTDKPSATAPVVSFVAK